MTGTWNIIDLFSGCGGFSLGAHLAGFHSALTVDVDKTLSSSIKLNFPQTNLINADLGQISSEELLKEAKVSKVHGVIGGPPCQGFSMMGKRDKLDPRNDLVSHFFRHVKAIQPDFFIMENVPGLLTPKMRPLLDNAIATIKEDYVVLEPMEVNAKDYGAATSRKRFLVIGYKPSELTLHQDDFKLIKPLNSTVECAISDLPEPVSQDFSNYDWIKVDSSPISIYARNAKALPPEGLGWKVAIENLVQGKVSGFQITQHAPELVERYQSLMPGQSDPISRSKKLEWNKPSNTLRAGTGRDRGSYQAVRPIHPTQGRVISVREAARLQGFPDWFVFHPTKWHSFRMIGNSVSPYMSKAILDVIAAKLTAKELCNQSQGEVLHLAS